MMIMAEYIDREAVLEILSGKNAAWDGYVKVKNLPIAFRPVGEWVYDENGMDWGLGAWRCSVCHAKPETWWEADKRNNPYRCSGGHFCGNCGADMRKRNVDE